MQYDLRNVNNDMKTGIGTAIFGLFVILFNLAWSIGLVWVIIHFVRKFW